SQSKTLLGEPVIQEHSNGCGLRHEVMQQADPLGCQIGTQLSNAGEIAAWPVEARNETRPDWIGATHEDNWDVWCRGLCRPRAREVGKGHYRRHRSFDQFGRKRRQSIVPVFGPAIFKCHVMALDEANLAQASAESGGQDKRRSTAKKSNHRHGALLRA